MMASSRRVVTRPSSVSPDTLTATPVPTPFLEWQRAMRGRVQGLAFATLTVLGTYADEDGRNASPGVPRLAANLRLSERTVRRHLEMGRRAGWIVRDEQAPDTYTLTVPAERGEGGAR